ncbi:hypothetical protein SVIOM342S_07215 [Streptomyces violaceorubidus]
MRPSFFITRKVGIIVSWNGTAMVASISPISTREPANRIRAKAYPASEPKTRFAATVTAETISELTNQRGNIALPST